METKRIFMGLMGLFCLALIIGLAESAITGDIEKPTNGQKFNSRTNINFTISPEETNATYNITNVTLYTNLNGTWQPNTTIIAGINGTSVSWLMNGSSDGNFSFNFLIWNNNSQNAWASTGSNYSFTLDTVDPSITSLIPADGTATSTEGDGIIFSHTPSDSNVMDNCTLYIDGSVQEVDSSITNGASNSFSAWTSTGGDHTWYVQCVDDHSNAGTSSTNDLGIKRTVGGFSSSSSGGGAVSNANIPKTLSIVGDSSSTGSSDGTSVWKMILYGLGVLAIIGIIYLFGGAIMQMMTPILTMVWTGIIYLISNPIGWVISFIIGVILLLMWIF